MRNETNKKNKISNNDFINHIRNLSYFRPHISIFLQGPKKQQEREGRNVRCRPKATAAKKRLDDSIYRQKQMIGRQGVTIIERTTLQFSDITFADFYF